MPQGLQLALVCISALNSILLIIEYTSMRSMVARQEHVKLVERVARLEESDRAGPGWSVLNDLRTSIGDFGGDLKEMRARVEGIESLLERNEAALSRLQSHILKVEG